jgi:hypothetical protein
VMSAGVTNCHGSWADARKEVGKGGHGTKGGMVAAPVANGFASNPFFWM